MPDNSSAERGQHVLCGISSQLPICPSRVPCVSQPANELPRMFGDALRY
jgi:hypothetical protein